MLRFGRLSIDLGLRKVRYGDKAAPEAASTEYLPASAEESPEEDQEKPLSPVLEVTLEQLMAME